MNDNNPSHRFSRRDEPPRLGEFTPPGGYRFDIHFCGDCPNAHILIFDDKDVPICQLILTARQAEEIASLIRARDPNFKV